MRCSFWFYHGWYFSDEAISYTLLVGCFDDLLDYTRSPNNEKTKFPGKFRKFFVCSSIDELPTLYPTLKKTAPVTSTVTQS